MTTQPKRSATTFTRSAKVGVTMLSLAALVGGWNMIGRTGGRLGRCTGGGTRSGRAGCDSVSMAHDRATANIRTHSDPAAHQPAVYGQSGKRNVWRSGGHGHTVDQRPGNSSAAGARSTADLGPAAGDACHARSAAGAKQQ